MTPGEPNQPHPGPDGWGERLPACRRALGEDAWSRLAGRLPADLDQDAWPAALARLAAPLGLPPFLGELAQLELALERVAGAGPPAAEDVNRLMTNPSLEAHELGWQGLTAWLEPGPDPAPEPRPGPSLTLIWRPPGQERALAAPAAAEDLLALKLVLEDLDPLTLARETGQPLANLLDLVDRAVEKGLLLRPASRLRRGPGYAPPPSAAPGQYLGTDWFTLQWHLTQACDLHCRHCYDRSPRAELPLEKALAVLEGLEAFCRERRVRGQVSLSGGNPLLYPHFDQVYAAAAQKGFTLALVGNPAPRRRIQALLDIAPLAFYQVSLEGLAAHNDYMRGPGHFRRTLAFLDDLAGLGVYAMVMLTLTRDNLEQVLPLARLLKGRCDEFNFNRLSLVGQGADLALPEPKRFQAFLAEYLEAAADNPALMLKDNLFNLTLVRQGRPPFGGCTGFGCGAAFNFLAALPDGQVHACRKFPSLVGNLFEESLGRIYDSPQAQAFRARSAACAGCELAAVCGGCLAVTSSLGLDIARDRDPFCGRD